MLIFVMYIFIYNIWQKKKKKNLGLEMYCLKDSDFFTTFLSYAAT